MADNILARDFKADRPNRKWLADCTCIWAAEGWLHVAVVLGPVLKPRRRLVDKGGPGRLTGNGRADDGRLAPRQG